VWSVNERLMSELFSRFSKWPVSKPPFPRLSYQDVMSRFGSDKPDLRNPLEISDLSKIFSDSQFKVFQEGLAKGGKVRAIPVPLDNFPSRKYFDDTVDTFLKTNGIGLAYIGFEGGGTLVVFLSVGSDQQVLPALGKLRVRLGQDFGKINKEEWRFCWVTDFPFYEKDDHTGELTFGHNPFSMPQGGLESLLNKKPLEILASQYDLVLNGNELASGAIRNHTPEVMYKAFEIVGYSKDTVDEKFGGMIRAFHFGAPPHGGIAHGVERIVMLLAGEEAIREVIAFPLAQNGEDLLMGAPSTVSEKQLREVHINLALPEKK
ncbi:MAG: aspartate--tRNA ligase, partial [Proteobacteria bacterium]